MATAFHIMRNRGHPWNHEGSWDIMQVFCETQSELNAFIARARERFWQSWIGGLDGDNVYSAFLYKPHAINRNWRDAGDAINFICD
jgi:hypothetical protein